MSFADLFGIVLDKPHVPGRHNEMLSTFYKGTTKHVTRQGSTPDEASFVSKRGSRRGGPSVSHGPTGS